MQRERLRLLGLVSGWILVAYVVGLTLFIKNTWRVDLEIMLRAAEKMSRGVDPYNLSEVLEHTKAPIVTLFFVPLTWMPQDVLFPLWDALNLALIVGMLLHFARTFESPQRRVSTAILLTTLLLLNPLNTELWTGQFNLMILAAVLIAVTRLPAPLRGLLLFLGLALKPPYLLLLPWVARYAPKRWLLAACTGLSAAVAFAVYAYFFGTEAVYVDHRRWLAFLPESTIKHLPTIVNKGLPSAIDSALKAYYPGQNISPLWICRTVLYVGMLVAIAFTWFFDKWPALAITAILVPVCSPMTWFQNYALMLPFVLMAIGDWSDCKIPHKKHLLTWGVLVPVCLTFPLHNPEFMKTRLGHWYLADTRVVLWGALISLVCWLVVRPRGYDPTKQLSQLLGKADR